MQASSRENTRARRLLFWLTRCVITEPVLLSCLSQYWGLRNAAATVHDGGMGSQTWFVDLGDCRWVAKAVAPDDGSQFCRGPAVAARLSRPGLTKQAYSPGRLSLPPTGSWPLTSVMPDWHC
jgi:hypothetical protein